MNRVSEIDIRTAKIQTLRDIGIQPFAQTWNQTDTLSSLHTEQISSLRSIEDILQ